jgi:maltooligosyltrehalose trehalohydrolase
LSQATTDLAERPLGAAPLDDDSWSFLLWAPAHAEVAVRIYAAGEEHDHPLQRCAAGYHAGMVTGLVAPPDYRYLLPDGSALADPVSRWQPAGVHGPSRGFDPGRFEWSNTQFQMAPLTETVIYELHLGTFTAAGTLAAAIDRLDDLVDLGVTAVEPMPVAAFPGVRNWGYDGVFPFAVQDSYGGPVELQRFVDACHRRGLAVILDVVYNHLGPEGNVLGEFGPYFTEMYATPWGAAVNVAEAASDEVRRYFTANAVMWLRDFHIDGLRLDAIHGIVDPTASPFLRELTATVDRLEAELGRSLLLIAESADNNPLVVSPAAVGGLGFDAQWNDDFHHCLHALLTGERDGYYQDYGTIDNLVTAFNDGFVFEGQYSAFRQRRHGASAQAVSSEHFVVFSQDHDQVGNRAEAQRLASIVEPAAARLAAAVTLLSPFVPMLFMGEEYAETAPFTYFIDHGDPDLVAAVRAGRASEFGRGEDSFDPASVETFQRAVLDWTRREQPAGRTMLALYRALLAARRDHPVLTDLAVLSSQATAAGAVLRVARRSTTSQSLLIANCGPSPAGTDIDPAAPWWRRVIDSTEAAIGGDGSGYPERIAAASTLELPAYGFALYIASTTEDNV